MPVNLDPQARGLLWSEGTVCLSNQLSTDIDIVAVYGTRRVNVILPFLRIVAGLYKL